jgi:hypothetical protein
MCYPEVTHLMCYFNVIKNCKEKLRSYGKDKQKDVLLGIQQLHSCTTETQYQSTFRELLLKWNKSVPMFASYFMLQCMTNKSFSCWKTYFSKPG